jgi:CheY-like chemotaxis protein
MGTEPTADYALRPVAARRYDASWLEKTGYPLVRILIVDGDSNMREERSLRDIPVILLSTENEGETRGKKLGVVRYVRKPLRADTLLSIIAEQVQGGEP